MRNLFKTVFAATLFVAAGGTAAWAPDFDSPAGFNAPDYTRYSNEPADNIFRNTYEAIAAVVRSDATNTLRDRGTLQEVETDGLGNIVSFPYSDPALGGVRD